MFPAAYLWVGGLNTFPHLIRLQLGGSSFNGLYGYSSENTVVIAVEGL